MDKANKVIRRGSVRLKSIGAGHLDLNMVISELNDLKQAAKVFMNAQNTASQDMVKWATCDENRAIQDIMSQLAELNSMWTDVQRDFIEQLKTFKNHFRMILESERRLDLARNHLVSCEQREQKIRKELKRAAKKATEEEINNLEIKLSQAERSKYLAQVEAQEIKLSQAERSKYLAQVEVIEQAHENEAIKLIRLKDGLHKLSEAYVELANKCAIIFEAQKEVSHYLPDIHVQDMTEVKYTGSGASKQAVARAKDKVQQYKRHSYHLVPSTPIIEDPPPPYTPGYYNPSTGEPYDGYNNRLNNQVPVIQRQRAVASATVPPSCPPYPSPSPTYTSPCRLPHCIDVNTLTHNTHQDEVRNLPGSNSYEDDLSGAMGAARI